jgi:hypothetical protein
MNHPKPTVLTYRIATTVLSAPEAAGLIPDLKVLIDGSPIQALYAYNVELLPRQGPYVDQAEVALSFSSPVRIYGIHAESPSDLHHLNCSGLSPGSKTDVQLPNLTREISSVQCTIRPILFQGSDTHPFRVTIATDKSEVPHVLAVAKNLDLQPADQFSQKDPLPLYQFGLLSLVCLLGIVGAFSILDYVAGAVFKQILKWRS